MDGADESSASRSKREPRPFLRRGEGGEKSVFAPQKRGTKTQSVTTHHHENPAANKFSKHVSSESHTYTQARASNFSRKLKDFELGPSSDQCMLQDESLQELEGETELVEVVEPGAPDCKQLQVATSATLLAYAI